jgi:hypothetical protein
MPDNYRPDYYDEIEKAMDSYVHAHTMIGEVHRMVHDGFAYHATGRVAALANAASLEVLFSVPADTFPHLNAALITMSDSPCDMEAFEGTTTSADGTAVTVFNRNRNSTNTAAMTMFTGPTITADGTQIHDRYIPDQGGVGTNNAGAVSPGLGEEWVLKPSTKYLLRFTNNSGGAITVAFEFLWYEIGYET